MSQPDPIEDPIGHHLVTDGPPLQRAEYEDDEDDELDFDDDDLDDDELDDDDGWDEVDASPGIDYTARERRPPPASDRERQVRQTADKLFEIIRESRRDVELCAKWAELLRVADRAVANLERLALNPEP